MRNPTAGATPQATASVIHANANLVLLDVVVTDRGSAVHGIDRSRFRVFEDGKEQAIASFEEHRPVPLSAQGYKPVSLPPHTYTNAPVYPQASAFNVLLLDGLNTPLDKQTDVRRQMVEYMGKIAPGTTLAVFTLSSRLRMITGFTTDASQLAKAMQSAKATPRTSDVVGSDLSVSSDTDTTLDNMTGSCAAGDWGGMLRQWDADTAEFQDAERIRMTLDAFDQLALYLGSIPGRKNVIWFSGSFPIGLDPDPTMRNGFDAAHIFEKEIHETSENLTEARISVYPVDARGLMNVSTIDTSYCPGGGVACGGSGGFGHSRTPGMTPIASDYAHNDMVTNAQEEASMRQIAQETGGKAYINTNGLRDAIADAVANGSSYYTITYVPENNKFNGSFRKLKVRVEGKRLQSCLSQWLLCGPSQQDRSARHHANRADSGIHAPRRAAFDADSLQYARTARLRPAFPRHQILRNAAGVDAAQLQGALHRTVVDLLVDCAAWTLRPRRMAARRSRRIRSCCLRRRWQARELRGPKSAAGIGRGALCQVRASGFPVRMELDLPAGNFSLESRSTT